MARTIPRRRRRDWSSLPELALFDIAVRLNAIDFLALAGVCKSWRTICTKNKAQITATQPPLLLALKKYYRNTATCEAYSFPDRRRYRKSLPVSKFFFPYSLPLGFSHGCILIYSCLPHYYWGVQHVLYLANPFTEEIIEMLLPGHYQLEAALLTAPPASPACMLVAFSKYEMMVGWPGVDARCSAVDFSLGRGADVRQAVFFKGCVYVVTHDTVVAVEIVFGPGVSVKKFAPFFVEDRPVKDSGDDCCPLRLFAREDELVLVELEARTLPNGSEIKRMFRLRDWVRGSWEEVESLGGITLFATNCSEFVPSGRRIVGWEQRGEEDRVFFVGSWGNHLGLRFHRATSKLAWVSPSHFL